MIIITNKSGNSIFALSNKINLEFKKNIPTSVTEENYKLLIKEYGCFFTPRIIKDNNILGCFEVIESKETKKEQEIKTLSYKDLKEKAKILNLEFKGNIKYDELLNLIQKAEND